MPGLRVQILNPQPCPVSEPGSKWPITDLYQATYLKQMGSLLNDDRSVSSVHRASASWVHHVSALQSPINNEAFPYLIPEICTGNICECIAAVPVLAVDRIIADCNDSF